MCVDFPPMAETYEKNMHEQLDRSLDLERQLKDLIARVERELRKVKSDSEASSTKGYKTPRYQFETPETPLNPQTSRVNELRPRGAQQPRPPPVTPGMPDLSLIHI